MAFGTLNDGHEHDEVMNEINMTPLVDVMLVLLIIFIITVPVIKNAVHIDLPRANAEQSTTTPEVVRLSVDAQGRYFWNDVLLEDAALPTRLSELAQQDPPPALQLRGDRQARYERIAWLIAAAQQAGLRKIGFVTDPASAQPTAPALLP